MTGRGVPRGKLIAAFAAIYLIWGSTYLGILVALETMPPFLMAGTRFLIAGALLYAWMRVSGAPRPARIHWRNAAIIGGLLLVGGNGGVVLAEQLVPSGLAALLVAILPIWMVLLDWARPRGRNPGGAVLFGLALGVIGLVVLIGPSALHAGSASAGGAGRISLTGVGLLIFASFSWAVGSLLSRHVELPRSAAVATAMEMLCAGAMMLVISVILREPIYFDPSLVSARSLAGWLYLVTFGSLVGFSAYVWLLKVAPPARVATYAYVNPVVAILLGWAFAGETLTLRTAVASAIIIGAVALITTARTRPDAR